MSRIVDAHPLLLFLLSCYLIGRRVLLIHFESHIVLIRRVCFIVARPFASVSDERRNSVNIILSTDVFNLTLWLPLCPWGYFVWSSLALLIIPIIPLPEYTYVIVLNYVILVYYVSTGLSSRGLAIHIHIIYIDTSRLKAIYYPFLVPI